MTAAEGDMARLRVEDLLADYPVQAQGHLDTERVAHYAQDLTSLPPIVVFDTEDGLLFADGYHRLAAARLRGDETIEAEIRHGSRHDALTYAATVGAAQHGITTEEAMRHLRQRGPGRWKGRPS